MKRVKDARSMLMIYHTCYVPAPQTTIQLNSPKCLCRAVPLSKRVVPVPRLIIVILLEP